MSCNFKTVKFLFKSHHAQFGIADLCSCVHLAFLKKSCPLVIYLVKICDLFRLEILQTPLIISTSVLVLGFTFSNTF